MPNQQEIQEGANKLMGHLASLVPSADGDTVTMCLSDITGTVHIQLVWPIETVVRLVESGREVVVESLERQVQRKREDRAKHSGEQRVPDGDTPEGA